MRSHLEAGYEHLDNLFAQQQHHIISQLVYARSWLVDQALIFLWQNQKIPQDLALVAVGGYGRQELHPYSDIDLLILVPDELSTATATEQAWQAPVQAFITALWDLGLSLGTSVRTVSQSKQKISEDITIATSMLESRTLIGQNGLLKHLFTWLMEGSTWSDQAFYTSRVDAQNKRYQRTGETEYNLEPNVKLSPGGLRDIQTIIWIGKRHFGLRYMRELQQYDFINRHELQFFYRAIEYLWTIRYALHIHNHKLEDRLMFDQQRQLAAYFGYKDKPSGLAVEQFMRKFYRVAMRVAELNQTLLQLFEQTILKVNQPSQVTAINDRFNIRNGLLEAQTDTLFKQQPQALMEAYVILAKHPECQGISAHTQRLIRMHRSLMDANLRQSRQVNDLFMELLQAPRRVSHTLIDMQRIGLLGRFLPAFGKIVGQMQHDLFHIYTVDAHTLKVIKTMRAMLLKDKQLDFPLATRAANHLPKIELLYLAGLFHDIAKGRGGDHSLLGIADAREFCQQLQLGPWDTDLVCWLVKYHLIMSITTQKRDISNPNVIYEFATLVQDSVHLDYLYVLTVCDIYSTNPKLWNGWRDTLLRQLYLETNRLLRLGLDTPIDHANLIEQTKKEALTILNNQALPTPLPIETIHNLWNTLGDDYFIREKTINVAWHTQVIIHHDSTTPLIAVNEYRLNNFESGSQVFIYTQDKPHLFATVCATLDAFNLTIYDARIITTSKGYSMDTFVVADQAGAPINDKRQIALIQKQLQEKITHANELTYPVNQRTSRVKKLFVIPTQVRITNPKEHLWTRLELICTDRPGLLAQVALVFIQFNLNIQKAKIQSMGERVEDVFFITDQNNQQVTQTHLLEQLEHSICDSLDSHIEKTTQ